MLDELKKQVFEANLLLKKYNLIIHTWGNVSQKSQDGKYIAIKPSGVSYQKMKWQDIVIVDVDGNVVEGNLKPSSDTPTHVEIYKEFKEINSIAHTHSPYATAFAQVGKDIECFGTTHADNFYGPIMCARSLTKEEIENEYEKNTGKVINETLKNRKINPIENSVILVKQHGPFVYSNKSAKYVANLSLTLEEVCRMAHLTLLINKNNPKADQHLIDKHYQRKHGKKAYYGQN